jgi:hypothetical protein
VCVAGLRITEPTATGLSIQWWFPPATPGDSGAWLGLFVADALVWGANGSPHGEVHSGPEYRMLYRLLTKNDSSGVSKFTNLCALSPPHALTRSAQEQSPAPSRSATLLAISHAASSVAHPFRPPTPPCESPRVRLLAFRHPRSKMKDGVYVFTLHSDYGRYAKAASEQFRIVDGRITQIYEGGLCSDFPAVNRKHRQQNASLNLLRDIRRSRDDESEILDERCYFPLTLVDVTLPERYQARSFARATPTSARAAAARAHRCRPQPAATAPGHASRCRHLRSHPPCTAAATGHARRPPRARCTPGRSATPLPNAHVYVLGHAEVWSCVVCGAAQEENPLVKRIYHVVDKASFLDWGLTSDYKGPDDAADDDGHRLRERKGAMETAMPVVPLMCTSPRPNAAKRPFPHVAQPRTSHMRASSCARPRQVLDAILVGACAIFGGAEREAQAQRERFRGLRRGDRRILSQDLARAHAFAPLGAA